jgi:Bacterial archaeo-eukaryotic release factor family 3
MKTLKAELTEFKSLKDLKPLLASHGPCLSLFMPLNTTGPNQSAKANELGWREIIRRVEPKVQQYGAAGRELLETVSDWYALSQGSEPQGKSIAVFRSTYVFTVSWVEEQVRPRAVLGPHFYVRPLLPELTRGKSFYVLALSQKNVRLLRCTSRTSEEVDFPAGIATSFDTYMNTAKPDHVLDNRASPGPGAGSSKGVMFGTSSEREAKDQYLAHFYGQIDRGVNEVLRGKTERVVLAGVEYEIALYRSVSRYPHVANACVDGAPNSLKSGEMHARAIDAILRCYEKKVDEALGEYNHKVGTGASNRLKDVVTAAHEGRVLTLLVSDLLETPGKFDESTYTVKGRETGTTEDEDLVNDAAAQTILHAGHVYVVPNSKMPNGAPLAAIYRF